MIDMSEMPPKVSVVLPCRNEEKTVGICIEKIKRVFDEQNIDGEIIVSDSSTDRSADIARSLGARVVKHDREGYGNAYLEGFKHVRGNYIIIGDSDDTYDFLEMSKFIKALDDGYEFVIGDRLGGDIKRGAMPWLHRYIGNPLLSFVLGFLFRTDVSDAHCGMRAFRKSALDRMGLRTTGMEFASEMMIKAAKMGLKIKEIPISYYPREGVSKLHSFRDGWKHLRFMLLYSPDYLFFIPGILLLMVGFALIIALLPGPFIIGGFVLDLHPIVLGSLLSILGYQVILLWLYAKTYAVTHLGERDRYIEKIDRIVTLDRGLILGVMIFVIGFLVNMEILIRWLRTGFGALSEVRSAIFALTLSVIGIQTIFSSFFLSILGIRKR